MADIDKDALEKALDAQYYTSRTHRAWGVI